MSSASMVAMWASRLEDPSAKEMYPSCIFRIRRLEMGTGGSLAGSSVKRFRASALLGAMETSTSRCFHSRASTPPYT